LTDQFVADLFNVGFGLRQHIPDHLYLGNDILRPFVDGHFNSGGGTVVGKRHLGSGDLGFKKSIGKIVVSDLTVRTLNFSAYE